MTQIQNSNDLLNYLIDQANSGQKNWFGFSQQKIAGINLAYELAKFHADKMSPDDVVDYVVNLNNSIFNKIIKGTK
jgi:hypothetical protein